MNASPAKNIRRISLGLALGGAVALGTSGCGGAGGSSTGQTLTGLILVNFVQAGEDNLPLNRVLQFEFSSPIDPNTVDFGSIQIRQGLAFGLSVPGRYIVQGSNVLFEPQLPGRCDLTDGGLQPNIDYRVTVVGSPEEFAIRDLAGHPLQATVSASFHTRTDTDPELFEDAVPGSGPTVVSTSPVDGTYPDGSAYALSTVYIGSGNKVVIDFSENIDPCTVTQDTITFYQYATGNLTTTYPYGFLPGPDVTPGDPYTWGSGTATSPPRRIRSNYVLTQTFLSTRLVITPQFTDALGNPEFPDNALLVVNVTNNVKDFGQTQMFPKAFAFVTENRPTVNSTRVFEFLTPTNPPIDTNITTADVNTARAPGRVQGYVLFAGDGDNGTVLTRASGPDTSNGPSGCTTPAGIPQVNDGNPDDFDTLVLGSVNLDTGSTINACKNNTDGSNAVVFEFRTFHIRGTHTVRIVGKNPAIILVSGDAIIDAGGALLARGDNINGAPQGIGANGVAQATSTPAGGTGVAGGGKGGDSEGTTDAPVYSSNGEPGYGSIDYNGPPFNALGSKPAGKGGATDPIRQGQGRGSSSINFNYAAPYTDNLYGPSAGGGGHFTAGGNGVSNTTGGTIIHADDFAFHDGNGGGSYGVANGKMFLPEAGSGGGGAGFSRPGPFQPGSTGFMISGGAGGAGGGFVDITAKGNIFVLGTLDAAGSRGGNGNNYSFYSNSSGGGGGSGGGIRLLTPGAISLGSSTTLTAGGGAGGTGTDGVGTAYPPYPARNDGGMGGEGRLSLEDGDSVITGYSVALVNPPDAPNRGFYRGVFDPTRFAGGGLQPQMTTGLIDIGPTLPNYAKPVQTYGTQEDFIASVPLVSSRGVNFVSIFVEANGFPANPDGTANLLAPTGWKSVGYFVDSGSELFPTWSYSLAGPPPPTPGVGAGTFQVPNLPQGNTGGDITALNGREFIKFRVTFYLKPGTGPFDAGPYIDRWTLHFDYNQ